MVANTDMAGKAKKQGSRPHTPDSARGMMGHLGLKSNARDQVRREAIKNEYKRRNQWLTTNVTNRPPTRGSEQDRDDMMVMMEELSGYDDDDLDCIDATPFVCSSESTSKVNKLTSDDLNFVNQMVTDNAQSPSKYHSNKVMKSYIPAANTKPCPKQSHAKTNGHVTSCGGPIAQHIRIQLPVDIIDKQAHHFTEEKPFTPRMLKSKPEVQSKLRTFKYYNPPKRSTKGPQSSLVPKAGSVRGSIRGGSLMSRPETPFSDSIDLMNETLMSRDLNQNEKPSGVPSLDISLDADHIRYVRESMQKGWIKEQSRKAQLRASAYTRSDAGSETIPIRQPPPQPRQDAINGTASRTLSMSQTLTKRYPNSFTLMKVEEEEEELKYLEFLTDVTNDVLDRGIFTNRVLKQVFANHIEKKQHELRPEKMHEMLENLRRDLGIPSDPEDDGLGMKSVHAYSHDLMPDGMSSSYDGSTALAQPMVSARSRRKQTNVISEEQAISLQKGNLPHLRLSRSRPGSSGGEGKPPLPRPGSRGSWSRPGSAASNQASLHEVKEEAEESSITFTDDLSSSHGQADVLKINHKEVIEQNGSYQNGEHHQPNMSDLSKEVQHVDEESGEDLGEKLTGEYAKYMEDNEEDSVNYDNDFHDDTTTEQDEAMTGQDDMPFNTEPLMSESKTGARVEPDGHNLDDGEVFEGKTETPKDPPKPTPRTRSTLSSSDFRETPRSTEHTHTSESVTVSELNDDEF
ncbi:hypothetical protein LSH36_8g10012 [Paralvinella palmiformis]|uniref:Spermatogenesis-associated protein 7 n=1 Tax=Paralvinella palmiformis TaxID=53620 RepID=A0AAD9KDE3_9ANNE|nr:hypothetical protein LSH36_8g10012 [Paralvinella palmiformis]